MMDKETLQTERSLYKIEPPSEATFTTLLNNIGNGIMLGAAPSVVMELYEKMQGIIPTKDEKISRGKLGLALTATGCVLGAVLGFKEARRLQDYRHKVSDEVAGLRAEVNGIRREWAEREKTRDEKQATAEIKI